MVISKSKTICMISCLHPLMDDRIYWKEALSLKKHGYTLIHLGVSSETYDKITEHNVRLVSIKRKTYYKNPYLDKLFRTITFRENIYKQIFQKAKALKTDVYHFHDVQLNRIGPKLKKLQHQPKVIYDVHEPYPITLATTISKNILVKLFWKAYGAYIKLWELNKSKYYDLIIATEENVQQKFKENLNQVPVEIIYNYTDIEPINSGKEKTYDFIYCGGIRTRRGVFEILEAIKLLTGKGVKSKTLLIGHIHEKGLEEKIRSFIKINKLEDHIYLKEAVPYDEVRNYYDLSKVGLCIFNDEKVNRTIMPIKIFEYIVLGLPVITSNFGHMRSISKQCHTGICINPSSKEELYTQMEKFLTEENHYKSYALNCYNAAPNFKWSLMEKRLVKIYNQLIK